MSRALFLQVRLDSTRLPGKALKEICGKTVIEHAMASLKRINLDNFVLVTAPGDDQKLRPLAEQYGFTVFTGDRHDVLKRYIDAGREYTPEIIMRATGDNPLVSWEMARNVLHEFELNGGGCGGSSRGVDYMAMKDLPVGCGVEVFKRTALETAYSKTTEPYDHEHVTPYIYNHPEQFILKYLNHDPPLNNRVTLDTQDDFERITKIFSALYKGSPVSFENLKDYLLKND